MVNNLELNKDKLGKLTCKVILVGGMISTLLTGGCKTKENSSSNPSVTEVTPTPTKTPDVASDNEQEEYKYYKIDFTVKVYNDKPQVTIESEKEVEYQNTETPEGGFVTATEKWQPHVPDDPNYDEGRADRSFYRIVWVYKRYVYLDYDELMNALNNMDYFGPNFNLAYGEISDEPFDDNVLDIRTNYANEIPAGEDDFYMVQGYVNVRKKVKVKSK